MKITVTYYYTHIRISKIKKADHAKYSQEWLYTAGGSTEWYSHSRKQFDSFSYKVKHAVIMRPSNCTPGYLPSKMKNPYINVYGNSIYNNQKLETT